MNSRTYKITKQDLFVGIYFILCKFQIDVLHHQGTSSKRDLLGGFIDRWINKIAEYLVFNGLLSAKPFEVVPDFFLYTNETEKNAPDVLGIKDKATKEILAFAEYFDDCWKVKDGMPHIEIKVFRANQAMIGIREAQMSDNHFYAIIEADIPEDYLADIFEDFLFTDEVHSLMSMSDIFIKSNKAGNLMNPPLLRKPQNLGSFRLLGVYRGDEIKAFSKKYGLKESVFYLTNIESVDKIRGICSPIKINPGESLFEYNYQDFSYLPFLIKNKSDFILSGKYKTSAYFSTNSEVIINGSALAPGKIKASFSKFERTSGWVEYIGYKDIFDSSKNSSCTLKPQDITEELLHLLTEKYNSVFAVARDDN